MLITLVQDDGVLMAKKLKPDEIKSKDKTVAFNKDEDFDMWKARISCAKKAREDLVEDGDKNVEHYEGKILPVGYKDTIAVNLVYVDMKQSVPEYYAQNPKIFVEPEMAGAETSAMIAEKAVNSKWDELKMKKVCRNAIKTAKLYGVAAFKTYFNFSTEFIKDEWDDRVKNDEVRTDVIPLKFLLKDPSAPSWQASSWIGHELKGRIADIAKRFDIPKSDIAITNNDATSDNYDKDLSEDFKYGTYYEIEDRRHGKTFFIVEGYDKLLELKEKKYRYDSMYDFLMYNDIPDRPDPLSDYKFWRPQLIELSTYRTMEVAHARKGNSKYISRGKKLKEEQKTQLKSSEDATVVELDVDQNVERFQHASLDPQLFQAEQACRNDIQIISKQAPRQSMDSKTATEVKAVEMASQQVSGENLERLEECMASIANKWILLMQDNYTATRTIALTGMSEVEFSGLKETLNNNIAGSNKKPFINFVGKDLNNKIKATIQAGSTAPNNDQMRMARFQSFAGFVSNAQLNFGIDQEEMLKEATEVFGVENDNLLIRKDNPMEESKLLNSGVYIAPKIGEKHTEHLSIHEREGNGNDENMIHILGHKMFDKQVKRLAEMKAVTAQFQPPMTGQSFMGNAPLPSEPVQGADNAPANLAIMPDAQTAQ